MMMSDQATPVWWIEPGDDSDRAFHKRTLAWVASLGLDPHRLLPRAAVVFHDGKYELHVDECAEPRRFDPLSENDLLTTRRIIVVDPGSWPRRPAPVVV